LEKHGSQVEVLYSKTALTALACPKLRDLQLSDLAVGHLAIGSGAWSDIAAATQLTSVSLSWVDTPFQPEAVSALTALPHLEQLSWRNLHSGVKEDLQTDLPDSVLLQHQRQLTRLELQGVTAEALQHLGSLSNLQHLSIKKQLDLAGITRTGPTALQSLLQEWDEGSLPDLQMLTALTSLEWGCSNHLPGGIYQLTALQQLEVAAATFTALDGLQVMPGVSRLCVANLYDLPKASAPTPAPWQLPALQQLELNSVYKFDDSVFNMVLLACCTQLREISVQLLALRGFVSSLGSSSILQSLKIFCCRADAGSWREFFLQGSAELPQLTMLQLHGGSCITGIHSADVASAAACCTGLKELRLDDAPAAPVLTQLPSLTYLHLRAIDDQQCSTLAQLTGLRALCIDYMGGLNVAGLRELTALQQLTRLGMLGIWSSLQASEAEQRRLTDTPPGSLPRFALVNKVRPVPQYPGYMFA